MSMILVVLSAILSGCVGYIFVSRVPSIVTFLLLFFLAVVTVFLVLRFLQEQKKQPLPDWLNKSVDGEPTKLERIQKALGSITAIVTYGLIALGAVVELVRPDWYLVWIGGEHGWAIFFAALISIPMATRLIQTGKWPLRWAGIFILAVGFLSPLFATTKPGHWVSEMYQAMWEPDSRTPQKIIAVDESWSMAEKVLSDWELKYRRVNKADCVLVRYNENEDLVSILGDCEAPEEFKYARRGGMNLKPLTQVEFKTFGKTKTAKVEVVRIH